MDKQWLEEYRSAKAEIRELQYALDHLAGSEILIGNSVILDYRKGYPQPQSLVGYDHNLEEDLRKIWNNKIDELKARVGEVEAWIEAIPDSITRRCFRMYYMEGKSQAKIGRAVHASQATVSEKMSKFLKSDKTDKKV